MCYRVVCGDVAVVRSGPVGGGVGGGVYEGGVCACGGVFIGRGIGEGFLG